MTESDSYVAMTFDGVTLRYRKNDGPRCFLADLADFADGQGNAADRRGRMAHTLRMADNIDFGETSYGRPELERGAGRPLSQYVVENSYYVQKFIKLDGFFRQRSLVDPTAGAVANLCEEFVGLQNYLFSQLLPENQSRSNERIHECVCAYVDCASCIMEKFWRDPDNMDRAFTCTDTAGNGFQVVIDTNSAVGTSVREAVLYHQMASIPPGERATFVYRRHHE